MSKITKVVKIPVIIKEDNDVFRKIKYGALEQIMRETRYFGNIAIRNAIAYRLENIDIPLDENNKPISLDTLIYRIITKQSNFLPSAAIASLIRNYAIKMVKKDDKDAKIGKKSLPTFNSLFALFRHQGTKISKDQDGKFIICPSGFAGKWLSEDLINQIKKNKKISKKIEVPKENKKLELISNLSWKDKGSISIVDKIIKGEYKLSDSRIISSTKKKKIKGISKKINLFFVLLSYNFESKENNLNPLKICGVDLGIEIPAVCAINNNLKRLYLGQKEDIYAARSKFRAERKRSQKKLGLYSKTKKWEKSSKEKNWIQNYYHTLTKRIINFCIDNSCGTIHVEDLSSLRKNIKNEYERLLWVPSKFIELLSYKAKENNIILIKINPKNTSRRCSKCGFISETNRKSQSKFICDKCGFKSNADYNAAKNISLASGEIIDKGYV